MVANIPKSEGKIANTYTTKNNTYIFTWNMIKNKFTLWKKVKGGYEKLTTSNSPLGFYAYVEKMEK